MSRFIELYSGNRNREQWPQPSLFEVPFASTPQNRPSTEAVDPVLKGTIDYKFYLYPSALPQAGGTAQPGSSSDSIRLDDGLGFLRVNNSAFYIGYTLLMEASQETRTVREYDAQLATIYLDKPLSTDPTGQTYLLYMALPSRASMYLPSLDINGNALSREEQAYTGKYVIFESFQPTRYSLPNNSNIFSRRISYYDNLTQLIYFDRELPFDYQNELTAQLFTLRPSVPNERWTPSAPTYINTVPPPPEDALRGPLIGPVIQLPLSAPETDNLYRGQYVYFASNRAYYFPEVLPSIESTVLTGLQNSLTIPNVFYPIYGAYYIRAYNGTTRQLSIGYDIHNTPLPTYELLGYSSASLVNTNGEILITDLGGGTFRGDIQPPSSPSPPPQISTLELAYVPPPNAVQPGKTMRMTLRMRKSANVNVPYVYVTLNYLSVAFLTDPLTTSYQTFVFEYVSVLNDPLVGIAWDYVNPLDPNVYIEWDLFQIEQVDPVNLVSFSHDNFSPMMYSGTMVSANEAVCYDLSLSVLSLPNTFLRTGGSIAFYPFLYVLLENITSPTSAAPSLIYSNNPETARAVFVATCFPTPDPSIQRFISLSSSVSHSLKFKPNDAVRFSIYLSDGSLFQPLVPAVLSPYPYQVGEQVYVVFSLYRP